jgi:hypothetical protein
MAFRPVDVAPASDRGPGVPVIDPKPGDPTFAMPCGKRPRPEGTGAKDASNRGKQSAPAPAPFRSDDRPVRRRVTRFELIFRDDRGERTETRDNSTYAEPLIEGKLIVDGGTYTIRNSRWVVTQGGPLDGMERFICVPDLEP